MLVQLWLCRYMKGVDCWTLRESDATEFPTQEAIDIISELRKDKGIRDLELIASCA